MLCVAMGFVFTSTASGQGSLSLGGLVPPTEVAASIVTPADLAVFTGVSPVRRVHKQAWYGLGAIAAGGPLAGLFICTWFKYVEMEIESLQRAQPWFGQVDTLVWDVYPGGVMYFEVDW